MMVRPKTSEMALHSKAPIPIPKAYIEAGRIATVGEVWNKLRTYGAAEMYIGVPNVLELLVVIR